MINEDFYLENNCIVLTESFLKKRGFCCHLNCRHCPWRENLKTRYQLKTSNDLLFDFQEWDRIIIEENYEGKKIRTRPLFEIDQKQVPFYCQIENERYMIISLTKINEVENMTVTNEFKGKKRPPLSNEEYFGDHDCA